MKKLKFLFLMVMLFAVLSVNLAEAAKVTVCDIDGDNKKDIVWVEDSNILYSNDMATTKAVNAGDTIKSIYCANNVIIVLKENGAIQYVKDLFPVTIQGVLSEIAISKQNSWESRIYGVNQFGGIYVGYNMGNYWSQIQGQLEKIYVMDMFSLLGLNQYNEMYYTSDLQNWSKISGLLSFITIDDINRDGKDDILGLNSAGQIYLSTDLATWQEIPGRLSFAITGDLNGDGKKDLIGLNSNGEIFYTLDMGTTWTQIPGIIQEIATGDLNGDRKTDIVGIGYTSPTPANMVGASVPNVVFLTDLIQGFQTLVQNGPVCGTAHQRYCSETPTTDLCAVGDATPVVGNGPYNWICQKNGMATPCVAYAKIYDIKVNAGPNGSVSPTSQKAKNKESRTFFITFKSGYMLDKYSAKSPSHCTNISSFQNIFSAAPLNNDCEIDIFFKRIPINGVCGTSNGKNFETTPTTDLCASGVTSAVTVSGDKYTWNCEGEYNGTDTSCSANKLSYSWYTGPWNNSCSAKCGSGTTDRQVYCQRNDGAVVSDNYCSGPRPASTDTCYVNCPVDAACSPNAGSCAVGTASALVGNNWTCYGVDGGANVQCTAATAQCGAAYGGIFTEPPTTGLCNVGAASAPTPDEGGGLFIWTCTNGTSVVECAANKQI